MLKTGVLEIFNEALDMHDLEVFKTVHSFNEAEQKNAIVILANRLYKMITNKLEDMDFKEIERSGGDVTRMKNYKQTKECIETLVMIAQESGNGIEETNEIARAMKNVEELRPLFTSAFRNNVPLVKYFYDTILLAIIADIGFMTTVCVEFIKNPNSTVGLEITNLQTYKTKFYLVHSELVKFNAAVDKGQIDKAFKALVTAKTRHESYEMVNVQEGIGDIAKDIGTGVWNTTVTIGSMAIIGLVGIVAMVVLPILRDLSYLFYSFRAHLSDWFSVQEELLKANEIRLRSMRNTGEVDYKEVADNQRKWANRMGKMADMLAVKYVPAQKNVYKQLEKDSKLKITKDEVDNPSDLDGQPSLF